MEPKHVVVTGGLGFIGSHLADAYLDAGCRVTIIDSEVSSVVGGTRYDKHPNCTLRRQSIAEFFDAGGSFHGVNRVIHAASRVGPVGLLPHAGKLGAEIVHAADCVIGACLAEGAPLCQFSSAEVYGRSGLLAEGDDIRVPTRYNARIEYAIAKTLTEAMVVNSRRRGLKGFIVRPFNVAGPRQSKAGGFVIPTFVQQSLSGRPLTVFSSGQQVRSFTAVADLVRFVVDFFDLALQANTPIFNVGSERNRITIWELAQRIKSLARSNSDILLVDGRTIHGNEYFEAESVEKVPRTQVAAALGWQSLTSLDDLILQTIAYYRTAQDLRSPP